MIFVKDRGSHWDRDWFLCCAVWQRVVLKRWDNVVKERRGKKGKVVFKWELQNAFLTIALIGNLGESRQIRPIRGEFRI